MRSENCCNLPISGVVPKRDDAAAGRIANVAALVWREKEIIRERIE